ncbi:MAG: glycosyltransferase [Novosphingobium sp.]|uniref:glycosyltransferase n=1 Tax=Novosphingobium sp. TaxID=1874826 RepID=UPI0032BA6DA3
MKIAVPIHSFEPGGVERVALNLCAAWQAQHEQVTVVLGREAGAMRSSVPAGLCYAIEPEPVPTAAFETLWMIRLLRRYLARGQTDVVFASGNTYGIVAVAMKLLLGRRCPPIVLKLSNDLYRKDMPAPYRAAYHLWLRAQGRWLDHFVGMAQPMRAEIAELMRVPGDRITVIEDPSLEEGQYAALIALPRSAGVRAPDYIAVGRLAGQKNFPMLLRAFARIGDPDAQLTILGEGPERGRLEQLAAELGIADRLHLPGHIADPLPYLARASVFVLSSDYEGVPAVVIEALAAGLPIAATDCAASMRQLTGDGQFGLLVPPREPAQLAQAMQAALTMPYDPAAARRSAQPYRIDKACAAYRALFATVAAPH